MEGFYKFFVSDAVLRWEVPTLRFLGLCNVLSTRAFISASAPFPLSVVMIFSYCHDCQWLEDVHCYLQSS